MSPGYAAAVVPISATLKDHMEVALRIRPWGRGAAWCIGVWA